MKQGWYWLAAGVMAMGLNGAYHDAGAEWAQRIADLVVSKSEAVIALASGRAERFLTLVQLSTARERTAPCRFATAVARLQTKIAGSRSGHAQTGDVDFEGMTARQEAALARLEAKRARIEAQVARLPMETASFEPMLFESMLRNSFGMSFATRQIKVPVVCPRVRVNIPRNVMTVPAPMVHLVTASAGPV